MPVKTDGDPVADADDVDGVVEDAQPTAEEIDAAVETTELVETPAAETFVASKPSGRNWAVILVAAALVGLLALNGFLGWKLWQQHTINQARVEVNRVADSYAQVLTSIDPTKIDENIRDVLDGATGRFKEMYSMASTELRAKLLAAQASSRGSVISSAVQDVTPNEATVLLFIDQAVVNSQNPQPRVDRIRMKMTMEKVDGRWRASDLQLP